MKENRENKLTPFVLVLAFFIILACWNSCEGRDFSNDPEMNVIR